VGVFVGMIVWELFVEKCVADPMLQERHALRMQRAQQQQQ
jgi:hypothetical protein